MAEIEHTIKGDEEAEIELDDEFGYGFYLNFLGNGSAIRVYLDDEHLQKLYDRLTDFGYKPSEET